MRRLTLNPESVRVLSGPECAEARGGFILLSIAQPEACIIASEAVTCPSEQIWNCNTIALTA